MKFKNHNKYLSLFLLLLFWGVVNSGPLQADTKASPDKTLELRLLTEVLDEIGEKYQVIFSYESKLLSEVKVDFEFRAEESVDNAIKRLLSQTGLQYQVMGSKYYVLHQDTKEGNRNAKKLGRKINQIQKLEEKGKLSLKHIQGKSSNQLSSIVQSVVELKSEISISGKVTAVGGEPLIGAAILVKNTSGGTVTDLDGNYQLNVPDNASILVFSYIGYTSQEVEIGGRSVIDVQLVADATQLDEVIVVGYATQKKKDITGAVTSVRNEDFNQGVITSPEQLLQGKVSGVNVTSASGEPGSNQAITIRGQGSVRSSSTPLFVVDGFALDNSGTGASTNPLNFINPQDIESIDVLKDASATAIYGARGANGVILITTKRGKAGVSKVSFSSSLAVSNLAREIPVFSASEFRKNVVAIGGDLTDLGGNTNWQRELTQTAISHNQNLVLNGGTEKLTYYASLGVQDQEGIIKNSGLQRYSGRVNVTQKLLNDRLKIDFNLNATSTTNERPPIGTMVGDALTLNPTYPAYDSNGDPSIFPDVFNPLIRLNLYDDITRTRRVLANISPSFEIIKGLVYKLNLGVDESASDRDVQDKPSTLPLVIGALRSTFVNNSNTLVENYITYTFDLQEHSVSLLAGHSYQNIFVRGRSWGIEKFADNGIEPLYNPGLGQELDLVDNRPSGFAVRNELQSFFGRANYSYKDKYLLTGTIRADGSSKFGESNKYGIFPSFAAGWRITEESFMESSFFSNLKLRLGWGRTGNQEIPSKITQALYTTSVSSGSSYPFTANGPYPAGTTFVRLANPDIQWEVSTQTNVGLDFEILDGALSGTIDYFHKVSNNILLEVVPPDPIQPATTYWTNIEDMTITNKGLELALDYQIRKTAGLSYGIGGNITFIDNVVEDSPFTVLVTGSASGSGLTSATVNGYVNGEPIGSFYMKDFAGIGDDGLSKFRDVNGDGLDTDDDRTVVGSALPTTMYNFYANLSYKGFDFNVNFNGIAGNKIYDNTATAAFYKARLAKSLNTTAVATEFPQESILNPASVSTRYLKDGSFLRLNNMSLGYNFVTEAMGNSGWVKELRLSVTSQNLFLITNYDGYDPEVNQDSSIDGIGSYGIDKNGYPKARTLVFGLNVTF